MITTMWDMFVFLALKINYPGIFLALLIEGVGLPFPGDAALAFYGYLSGSKIMKPLAVLLIATLGSGTGSIIAFLLGKHYGLSLLRKYGKYLLISDRSIELAIHFTRRYGVFVLLFGRLFPGVRGLSSYVAGLGRLSFPIFLIFSFVGYAIFCLFWIAIGYLLTDQWQTIVVLVQDYLFRIMFAAILLISTFLLWKNIQKLRQ